jgi:hypothetical protein
VIGIDWNELRFIDLGFIPSHKVFAPISITHMNPMYKPYLNLYKKIEVKIFQNLFEIIIRGPSICATHLLRTRSLIISTYCSREINFDQFVKTPTTSLKVKSKQLRKVGKR